MAAAAGCIVCVGMIGIDEGVYGRACEMSVQSQPASTVHASGGPSPTAVECCGVAAGMGADAVCGFCGGT